jgi:hypothetical protein
MKFLDLWNVLVYVFLPTMLFIGIGFSLVYTWARFIGKINAPGQGVLVAAFALLGGILGVSVGASRSPELGAILPALLTAITALLGYWFGKEHLTEWRPVIPYCIIALLATSFFGLFVGSSIRGKHEHFEREHKKRLLYYEKVELELEKARKLKELKNDMESTKASANKLFERDAAKSVAPLNSRR